MKEVLLSIKPKYCELIASGKKTVEVRKTRPKLATPFKCYIYMTKAYDTLFGYGKPKKLCVDGGKVIGEFVCNKIDRIAHCGTFNNDIRLKVVDRNLYYEELDYAYLNKCKLSYNEIDKYSKGRDVYGWHISDLIIYDKPKELSEFYRKCDKIGCDDCEHFDYEIINDDEFEFECEYFCRTNGCIPITRPPQSWCYVESEVQSDEHV